MTEIELTRRRIVASILVIGLAAAAAGVGTFALFSDEATSENEINAGTLELDAVSGNFTVENLYPTQSTGNESLSTNYSAAVDANLSMKIFVDDEDFANQLDVESAELVVGDSEVNSFSGETLADINQTYNNISTVEDGQEVEFRGNFTLGENTTNNYQGDSVNITVTFNATQQT